jgi:hypothetical protein
VIIGQALPRRPATAFLVGVGSHLVLDACPHWGCDRQERDGEERFLRVAKRDGILGLAVMAVAAVATQKPTRVSTVAAMAGAALLDLDKPILHFVGVNPFPNLVNRIHQGVQNESSNGLRNELLYGVAFSTVAAASWIIDKVKVGIPPSRSPRVASTNTRASVSNDIRSLSSRSRPV